MFSDNRLCGRQEEAQQYMATLRQQLPDYRSNLYLVEARWLTDSDATTKALTLLSTALKNDLNNTALRFERAIVAEKLGKYALMESDFRYILLEKPDDIATLNALGYALTNHSTRYKEAQQLIEKALAQQPEDAAIIDSMGWVQFKQGELDKAEPAGAAGVAVHDEGGAGDLAVLLEHFAELRLGGVKREVAYIELHTTIPSHAHFDRGRCGHMSMKGASVSAGLTHDG